MTPLEVLVIGASGKTGRAVTRALVARGVRVRAAVRPGSTTSPGAGRLWVERAREPSHSRFRNAAELASPVTVDLATGRGLDDAVAGVDAVYHLAPNVHPDEVGIATRVADSAAASGVLRFVFHSVLHPDDASMPHHLRKAAAEEVIRARLCGATVLRPAAFGQNLLDAALSGRLAVPYSLDSPFTNVDLEDVAEVAARVLTEDGHEGATYDLAGPERLSVRELAAVAADVLGHRVDAVEIPLGDWLTGPGAALGEQAREDLTAMFRSYDRDGLCGESSTLAGLLGRVPRTWHQTLLSR